MRKSILVMLVVMMVCSAVGIAEQVQSPQRRFRGGLYGDWIVKSDFNGRSFESILTFGRDKEGNQTGQWIGFMGVSELKNLKFEEGKISFEREMPNREGQTSTAKFEGEIKEGKLTGTMTSSRGESKYEGARAPRMPRVVGNWAMKMKMGEEERTSTLKIRTDEEGKLTAVWNSPRGEREMEDIKYERGTVTFKNKPSAENNFNMTFEGSVSGDVLKGVLKSERGELSTEGTRIGSEAIGTWNLEVASERGNRKNRLKINPDMSAWYGSMKVDKVVVEDDKVSFEIVMKFGEREFKMSFAGTIKEDKLTGEFTTSMGAQKITGTKVIRTFGRGMGGQRPAGARPTRPANN